MERDRRRKSRRATDRCAHLLDKPDVKVLTLGADLMELSAKRRQAIEMYVQTQLKLMRLEQLIRK